MDLNPTHLFSPPSLIIPHLAGGKQVLRNGKLLEVGDEEVTEKVVHLSSFTRFTVERCSHTQTVKLLARDEGRLSRFGWAHSG